MYVLGKNGLEPIAEKSLPLFSLVHFYGAFMSYTAGVVISLPNSHGHVMAVTMEEEPIFRLVDSKTVRPISKKFGIGTYYDDELVMIERSVAEGYQERATKLAQEKAVKEAAAVIETARIKAELPGKFPYLTPVAQSSKRERVTTAENVRRELKASFPGVKFSVKIRSYDALNVSWIEGPSQEEVDNVLSKFEAGVMDWSGDFCDYTPSLFNVIFGGFKYIFTSRKSA